MVAQFKAKRDGGVQQMLALCIDKLAVEKDGGGRDAVGVFIVEIGVYGEDVFHCPGRRVVEGEGNQFFMRIDFRNVRF